MSKRTVIHVVPDSPGWKVQQAGYKSSQKFPKKKDALTWAKDIAESCRPSQIKIHGKDGKIQTEHTYGKDPERFKG